MAKFKKKFWKFLLFRSKIVMLPMFSKTLKEVICKTIIVLVVLYGCETRSLVLRDERNLQVYENKVLRLGGTI